eukprot:gene8943-9120_t
MRLPVQRKTVVMVVAHGAHGFVGEMRAVAMKLHTREQAPKEGGIEAPKKQKTWDPSVKGYLQFLAESQEVYQTFESIMKAASHPEYAKFQDTGLERSPALAADIAWFREQYGLSAPELKEDGPGRTYARHLQQIAVDDPQFFICHFYNYYFAHTAGGRMIGNKLAEMLLGGKELQFYQYQGDMNGMMDGVRANLNELAETWTREQKDHCLQETADAFKNGPVEQFMLFFKQLQEEDDGLQGNLPKESSVTNGLPGTTQYSMAPSTDMAYNADNSNSTLMKEDIVTSTAVLQHAQNVLQDWLHAAGVQNNFGQQHQGRAGDRVEAANTMKEAQDAFKSGARAVHAQAFMSGIALHVQEAAPRSHVAVAQLKQ